MSLTNQGSSALWSPPSPEPLASAEEIHAAWQRHAGDLDAMVDELEISERGLRQRLKDLGLRQGGSS
jgi:hypothetical protein